MRYYLDQQQGRGMPVFQGSSWQRGHGQMGYGLGGLFRSLTNNVKPLVKSGAKALGNIALNSGANFLGDLLAGKNAKKAAKARALEGVGVAKQKALQRAQTGRRKKRTNKKRKASTSMIRNNRTKKRKTSPEDIFG